MNDIDNELKRIDIKSYVKMALQNRDKKYDYYNRGSSINRLSRKSHKDNSSSSKKYHSKNKNIKYEYQHLKKYETSEMGNHKFNPQKTKAKPLEPLFSKYEKLDHKNNYQINTSNNELYKNEKEIFPSKLDMDMRLSCYSMQKTENILKSSITSNNTFNSNIKNSGRFQSLRLSKNKKNDKKTYAKNIESEKEALERKNFEENTKKKFESISAIEKSVLNKKKIKDDEINQLIFCFIDILYTDADVILKNKKFIIFYSEGINRIVKMIIVMNNIDQIKILEALKRTADSYSKMELYEKLTNEVEQKTKNKKIKKTNYNNILNNKEEYSYSNRAKFSESLKKSIK